MENLKTGDLLLFNDQTTGAFGTFTKMIKWGTHSNYSHTAVILRDPSFIHPSLKGLYVWESGEEDKPDPQDGKKKIGVQISPIDEVFSPYKRTGGHVYYRKVESQENLFTDEKLKEVQGRYNFEKEKELAVKQSEFAELTNQLRDAKNKSLAHFL